MKAISLWQPWASLVATGAKTYETRSWPTKYRGPLVICAAKGGLSQGDLINYLNMTEFQKGLAPLVGKPLGERNWSVRIEHMPFGAAVAMVDLIDCVKTDNLKLGQIENE